MNENEYKFQKQINRYNRVGALYSAIVSNGDTFEHK